MMTSFRTENTFAPQSSDYDFDLGVADFRYSDLFKTDKLRDLAEAFYKEVEEKNPPLYEALADYIKSRGAGYESKIESKILTDS
ncbi:MAG: hypothetical protein ACR2GD_06540, partial [Pyrinomonadaceae bacterium]